MSQISMSAKEYREYILSIENQKQLKKERKDPLKGVSYKYSVEFKNGNEAVVTLRGKHFSKNVTNTFSIRNRMRFKKMLKDSAYQFFILNPHMKRYCKRWNRVVIHYDIYNPKSRDTHNTDLKTFRDTFIYTGIIEDDNRQVIPFPPTEKEIISKEYKIVAYIKKIEEGSVEAYKIMNRLSLSINNNNIPFEIAKTIKEIKDKEGISIDEVIPFLVNFYKQQL